MSPEMPQKNETLPDITDISILWPDKPVITTEGKITEFLPLNQPWQKA